MISVDAVLLIRIKMEKSKGIWDQSVLSYFHKPTYRTFESVH